MEKCTGGTAAKLAVDLLDKNSFFDEYFPHAFNELCIAYVIKSAIYGLEFLHKGHAWSHGHLSGSSILLMTNGTVKIIHPMLCDLVEHTVLTSVNKALWMAPESLENVRKKKSDIRGATWFAHAPTYALDHSVQIP